MHVGRQVRVFWPSDPTPPWSSPAGLLWGPGTWSLEVSGGLLLTVCLCTLDLVLSACGHSF